MRLYLGPVLAWLLPGAGHFFLGRRRRALAFFVLVGVTLATGCLLDGELYQMASGQPLKSLASLACMAVGLPYFVLQYGVGYVGDVDALGFEYGKAFILTAGLMNVLLILDAWDIGRGEKD